MAKTYDCFSFFNELDLLEIRLHELSDVVDYFVLIEATRTFQNKSKPLHFQENRERFKEFLPRIKHIVVDDYPGFFRRFRKPTPWDFERNQREHVDVALKNCSNDDILILSDIDEIPKAEKVREAKNIAGLKVFEQRMYYYFLNCFVQDYDEPIPLYQDYKPWRGPLMLNYKDYTNFEDLRSVRNKDKVKKTLIREGGWHYSWLGGVEGVLKKLEAYAHSEHNKDDHKNPENLKKLITSGAGLFGQKVKTIIEPDLKSAPQYVQKNAERFRHLVLE